MRSTLGALVGGLVLTAVLPAAAAEAESDGLAKGRALLKANCARCHAIGLEDSSAHGQAPPFRVVVTRYPPDDLSEALAEGITSGHPDMPEFVFEVDEVFAITEYLNSLREPRK
jgi:mono/diheme cytochrome c family protein